MSQPPPKLDYEPPTPDDVSSLQMTTQAIGAAIITVFITFIYAGMVLGAAATDRGAGRWIALGYFAVCFIGANVFAWHAHRDPKRRGTALGVWIGLGVGLLLLGICFVR
jgi:hypothetical protein